MRWLIASYALFALPMPVLLACVLAANGCWIAALAGGGAMEALGLIALCMACGPTAIRRISEDDRGA